MASSFRSRLVPPHVGAGMRELGSVAEFRNVTRRFALLVWTSDPLEVLRCHRSEGHRLKVSPPRAAGALPLVDHCGSALARRLRTCHVENG